MRGDPHDRGLMWIAPKRRERGGAGGPVRAADMSVRALRRPDGVGPQPRRAGARLPRTQTGGAGVMVVATIVALVWANSPWSHSYDSRLDDALAFRIGSAAITPICATGSTRA